MPELLRGARLGKRIAKLDMSMRRELLDLFVKSAGDYLDAWFESAPIKAAYGFDGIVGNYASPYAAGSGYVLLHHVFGEVNGKKGAWGHAIGGMGAITQAMAKAAAERGVDIRVSSPVREVIVEAGRAVGVVMEDGVAIRARSVVSNLNPKLLYGKLIDASVLERNFRERMNNWRCGSGTFRMGLAPAGQHVASLFCQHVAPVLPDGASWDDHRDEVADVMIGLVNSHAPNFRASVLGRQIMSPLDLERTFGLVGGDIFHGALSLDQLFSARPMLGHGDYRGPLQGLYMCGSGTHPGGGVTGAPGHNAAREIIADFRRGRLKQA